MSGELHTHPFVYKQVIFMATKIDLVQLGWLFWTDFQHFCWFPSSNLKNMELHMTFMKVNGMCIAILIAINKLDSVTHFKWTPIFDWCVVRCDFKMDTKKTCV